MTPLTPYRGNSNWEELVQFTDSSKWMQQSEYRVPVRLGHFHMLSEMLSDGTVQALQACLLYCNFLTSEPLSLQDHSEMAAPSHMLQGQM